MQKKITFPRNDVPLFLYSTFKVPERDKFPGGLKRRRKSSKNEFDLAVFFPVVGVFENWDPLDFRKSNSDA